MLSNCNYKWFFSGPHICLPLLLDIHEDIVELIQLDVRVIWFRVDWDHHQVLQHCGVHANKHCDWLDCTVIPDLDWTECVFYLCSCIWSARCKDPVQKRLLPPSPGHQTGRSPPGPPCHLYHTNHRAAQVCVSVNKDLPSNVLATTWQRPVSQFKYWLRLFLSLYPARHSLIGQVNPAQLYTITSFFGLPKPVKGLMLDKQSEKNVWREILCPHIPRRTAVCLLEWGSHEQSTTENSKEPAVVECLTAEAATRRQRLSEHFVLLHSAVLNTACYWSKTSSTWSCTAIGGVFCVVFLIFTWLRN